MSATTTTNLYTASSNWATRPADERFSTLSDMLHACASAKTRSVESPKIPASLLRVDASGDEVRLIGPKGTPTGVTHHAFGQLASFAGAPAGYLRELPATLAAQNINHGLKARGTDASKGDAVLLMDRDPDVMPGAIPYTVRALTTESYSRVWDADIVERLIAFQKQNPEWVNPPAFARGEGDKARPGYDPTTNTVPSGLYASDHDMFAFMVDGGHVLDGSPKGINRGFFVSNSEVGGKSLVFTAFLHDKVCGNHIVWNARNVTELRIRHVGDADAKAWNRVAIELRRYAESAAGDTEAMIAKAKTYVLGGNKVDAVEALLKMVSGKRIPDLSEKVLTAAVETAEKREDRYGAPYTVWGAVSGLTENSQELPYTEARVTRDRAAGRLLEVVEI